MFLQQKSNVTMFSLVSFPRLPPLPKGTIIKIFIFSSCFCSSSQICFLYFHDPSQFLTASSGVFIHCGRRFSVTLCPPGLLIQVRLIDTNSKMLSQVTSRFQLPFDHLVSKCENTILTPLICFIANSKCGI